MEFLVTVGLVILAIVILIGIIRLIIQPADSIVDFFMQLMLLDWLGDILGWIFENIGDMWD